MRIEQDRIDAPHIEAAIADAGLRIEAGYRQGGGDFVRHAFHAIPVEPERDQDCRDQEDDRENAGH
ncbi:hypothetical protein D3C81_2216950 [compost metagenome]